MKHSQEGTILLKYGSEEKDIYLIVRKKRGRLVGEEKQALHKKIFDVSSSVFN